MEKRKNYKSESVSKEFAKDHEEEKRKAERSKSAMQKNSKSKRKEFIGWGSRSLIEFLASIGKDTSVTLSQHDVASIVDNYIKEKKLFDPKNKKRLTCDASLQSLFGKRKINKNSIYNLLESHFTENQDESEEDVLGNDSEGKTSVAHKRQRKQDTVKYSQTEGKEHGAPRSYFASIITENIKLVYLKKSLLFELFGQPESFEEKVIGSFVRVKIDPYDYRQKISHQLVQVKGVKKDSVGENNTEIILRVSCLFKGDIPMSKMSDGDFSKEECEDLRKRVMDGEIARPTVVEFEQKARVLHKDITKHWISRELALLQNLIDRANEKGWRRELFEYLERRKKLQTPEEQSRLLENVPVVFAELDSISDDLNEGSSKSIFQHSSAVHNGGLLDNQTSESLETKDKRLNAPITKVYSRRRKSVINSHHRKIDFETEEKAHDSEEPPCREDTYVEV